MPHSALGRRAHSLVLSANGMTIKDIAKTYQVHRVTVSAWIKKWERHGVQSLHDQPRSGRPPTLTPDEQALAQHYIKEEPSFAQTGGGALSQHTPRSASVSRR